MKLEEIENIKRHLGMALYNHTRNFYDYDMQVDCNITYNQLKLLGDYINQLETNRDETIKLLSKGITFCENDSQGNYDVCNNAINREKKAIEILERGKE